MGESRELDDGRLVQVGHEVDVVDGEHVLRLLLRTCRRESAVFHRLQRVAPDQPRPRLKLTGKMPRIALNLGCARQS